MAGKRIVLDSCIVIDILRGNQEVISRLYQYHQDDIFITPVVIAEFYRGAKNKTELQLCRNLIMNFNVLSLNANVADTFLNLFDEFSLSHRPAIPDMLIAATAVYYNIPLYTHNKRDFQFIDRLQLA